MSGLLSVSFRARCHREPVQVMEQLVQFISASMSDLCGSGGGDGGGGGSSGGGTAPAADGYSGGGGGGEGSLSGGVHQTVKPHKYNVFLQESVNHLHRVKHEGTSDLTFELPTPLMHARTPSIF